jgi:hypothetical protein
MPHISATTARPQKCRRIYASLMLLAASTCSFAQLPKRDLTVEVRQIVQGQDDAVHFQAGNPATGSLLQAYKVQVRNGEKASVRMETSVPMQWTSAVQAQSAQGASGNGAATNPAMASGNGATQSVHWFDVGQSLTVQPRWSGGNKDAQVELEVQQSEMQQGEGGNLPAQRRNHVSTSVTAPLAQWVTVAASGTSTGPDGAPVRQGSYSSEAASTARRLLQIRVLVP